MDPWGTPNFIGRGSDDSFRNCVYWVLLYSEITLEKVVGIPSDTKVGQFNKKLFMRNSVESLTQVYEYANNMFFISQC